MTTQMIDQIIEEMKKVNGNLSDLHCKNLLAVILAPEDMKANRILRGHAKTGCVCKFCKAVLGKRIVQDWGADPYP